MRRALLAVLLLAACRSEEAAAPDPIRMTAEALSHFCLMQVSEHPGPKAQIHLDGFADPIFFAQVRDALAYLKGAERDAEIAAFYVSDMAAAPSWERPGAENWIAAAEAAFVVGADVRGGMGAPEIVPFGTQAAAQAFARDEGGVIMRLDEIPAATVLAPVNVVLKEETEL